MGQGEEELTYCRQDTRTQTERMPKPRLGSPGISFTKEVGTRQPGVKTVCGEEARAPGREEKSVDIYGSEWGLAVFVLAVELLGLRQAHAELCGHL